MKFASYFTPAAKERLADSGRVIYGIEVTA